MMKQVGRVLNVSDELTKKKNQSFLFKCCSECHAEVNQAVEQLLKTNQNKGKQLRHRSDSVHETDNPPSMVQAGRAFNAQGTAANLGRKDAVSHTITSSSASKSGAGGAGFISNRRAVKMQHASSFGVIAFHSQTLLSDITLSMGADDRLSHAVKQHNFHQVAGLEEFMIELNKLKLTDSLLVGVIENFLSKLLELDMDENLEYDLALDQLVKIFSVTSRTPMFDEEALEMEELGIEGQPLDVFASGVVRSTRGTIIQKVMRSKVEIENTAINNILLLSLPITSPYRILDKSRQENGLPYSPNNKNWAARMDAGYSNANEMRETTLLPQAGMFVGRSTTNNTSSVHSIADIDDGGRESGILGIQPNQRIMGGQIINGNEGTGFGGTILQTGNATNTMLAKLQKPKVSFPQELYISLDSFTFVKKQFTNYILDHVEKNQVELIFSTETLPATLFEQLTKKGVLAVFPISQAEMQLLSMVLHTKIIKDVSLLTKEIDQEYLGNIRKYYMVNLEDTDLKYQSTLIFLDQTSTAAIEATYSLGVTIYYQNADVSENLRNFVRSHLIYLYYALTEHDFMLKERDQTRALNPSVSLNWEEIGDFRSPLSSVKHNIRLQVNSSSPDLMAFERTEIVLGPLNDESVYPDFDDYSNQVEKLFQKICAFEGIKLVHDIQKKVDESLETPKEYENFNYLFNTDSDLFCSLNITKGDSLYTIQSTTTQVVLPYSDKDTTLARFLKRYFKRLQGDAKEDDTLQQTEIGYYIADSCIRLKVSSFLKQPTKSKFKKLASEEKKENLYFRGLFYNRLVSKLNQFRSTRSSMASRAGNLNDLIRPNSSVYTAYGGKLPSHPGGGNPQDKQSKSEVTMSKDHINTLVHQNATIRCYVVCDTCQSILSDPIMLDSFCKNMSFTMFLYNFAVARPSQSLFNAGKNLRQMQNTQLFGEMALQDDFCPHTKQSRAFHLGQQVIQFTRYSLQPHKLIHFSNRDVLLGLDPLLLEIKRGYLTHQRQYQDKVAVEISEYFIKQITLLVYVIRDYLGRSAKAQPQLIVPAIKKKGVAGLGKESTRNSTNAAVQTKLTALFIQLCEIASKMHFVNHHCGKRQQLYKSNPLLRSVHSNLKSYSLILTELTEVVSPEKVELAQKAPAAFKFCEIVSKICKWNLEIIQEQTVTEKTAEEKNPRDTRVGTKLMSNFGGNQTEKQTLVHSNFNQPAQQVSAFGVRPTMQSNFTQFHRPDAMIRRANSENLPAEEVSMSELWENPKTVAQSKEEAEGSKFDTPEPKSPLLQLQRAVSVRQDLPNRRVTLGNLGLTQRLRSRR